MKKRWLLVPIIVVILALLVCGFCKYWYIDADGQDYIFYNVSVEEEIGCGMAPYVSFSSMEEMVKDIRFGRFTKAEKEQLAKFLRDEDYRIPICDLDTLYAPIFPEGTSYTIDWYGTYYVGQGTDSYGISYYQLMDRELWEEWLSDARNADKPVARFDSKDRNAKIIRCINKSNKMYYRADYEIENGDTTLYVFEYFDDYPGVTTSVRLYGQNDGQYFFVSINTYGTNSERLPLEHLKQFGIERYTGE